MSTGRVSTPATERHLGRVVARATGPYYSQLSRDGRAAGRDLEVLLGWLESPWEFGERAGESSTSNNGRPGARCQLGMHSDVPLGRSTSTSDVVPVHALPPAEQPTTTGFAQVVEEKVLVRHRCEEVHTA